MDRQHWKSGPPARSPTMPPPQSTPADAAPSSSDNPKPRRFAPEPIETTSKSSKSARKHSPDKDASTKVRRFAPVPIESSTTSSWRDVQTESGTKSSWKDGQSGASTTSSWKDTQIGANTTSSWQDNQMGANTTSSWKDRLASSRNEANTTSSWKDRYASGQTTVSRRFAPQPVETTQKSSKNRSQDKPSFAHIKFKPQLVETQYGGNRKSSRQNSKESEIAPGDTVPRKFTPEILSTAKRSRRAGKSNAANYADYRTEEGHQIHVRELQKHAGQKVPPADQVPSGSDDVSHPSHELPPGEARRQLSPHDGTPGNRSSAAMPTRTHSYRLPDLEPIESSESERESGPSSMSCSPGQGSPLTNPSDTSFNEYYKHATRIRESVDENFSQYLLQLEAKKAQQRLQEQALAAFPNSDFHEPVQHYVNDDQDSVEEEIEDRPVTWSGFDEEEFLVRVRRESTKTPWEQLEMQRHAENLEQERKANQATAGAKHEPKSPWWNPDVEMHQPDSEMRSMRDRARPPMLGRDLRFPRCPSPEPARFDVTQGSDKLRQQMCYLSQQSSQNQPVEEGGLWSAKPKVTEHQQSMHSANSKTDAKSTTGKGLWGGFCYGKAQDAGNTGLEPPPGPTGLMTPRPREGNPFEQSFAQRGGGSGNVTRPPTPPESAPAADPNSLDAILVSEKQFEEVFEREYPDSFVTQVFNYLSLGYPSLARPFDEELSKISRIPVADLRQDDIKAKQSPKGYIRLDPVFEGEGLKNEDCIRWQALKEYIREWARQEKNMVRVDAPGGNWATTNRRGSWAI